VAKAVAVAMDAREVTKKAEQAKELEKMQMDFQQVNGETHAPLNQ